MQPGGHRTLAGVQHAADLFGGKPLVIKIKKIEHRPVLGSLLHHVGQQRGVFRCGHRQRLIQRDGGTPTKPAVQAAALVGRHLKQPGPLLSRLQFRLFFHQLEKYRLGHVLRVGRGTGQGQGQPVDSIFILMEQPQYFIHFLRSFPQLRSHLYNAPTGGFVTDGREVFYHNYNIGAGPRWDLLLCCVWKKETCSS